MAGNDNGLAAVGAAGLFGIYLDAIFNLYSFTNSSPQTTELFADQRAKTLMKYVRIGDIAGIAVGAVGFMLAPKGQKIWPILGAGSGVIFAHFLYQYALKQGTNGKYKADVSKVKPVYRGQADVTQLVSQPPNYDTYQENAEQARGQR
jgi:hypothetical protein